MSNKKELKNAIAETEQEIEALEQKLFRSQTKLMLALLEGEKPDKPEVDFFKMYASLIESARKRLVQFSKELNGDDND